MTTLSLGRILPPSKKQQKPFRISDSLSNHKSNRSQFNHLITKSIHIKDVTDPDTAKVVITPSAITKLRRFISNLVQCIFFQALSKRVSRLEYIKQDIYVTDKLIFFILAQNNSVRFVLQWWVRRLVFIFIENTSIMTDHCARPQRLRVFCMTHFYLS